MTTAIFSACFTGLVRAIGMLLTVIILAEFIYFLLFSEISKEATGNKVCNPYRLKNASKLTAQALGFIFFVHPGRDRFAIQLCKNHSSSGNYFSSSTKNYSSIHPGNYHSSTLQRNDVTRKLFANGTMQNLTTCL